MPFRTRLKRALGGGGSSETSSNFSKTDSKTSKKEANSSTLPDNVYKPGEPMPRPKYRGPWNQAHQDKLSAFSFGSISSMAGRRRRSSAQGSDYSPRGSKLPSRGPSQGPSRRGSAWSALSGGSDKRRGMGGGRHTDRDDRVEEADGDADIANVGLSRQHTAEDRRAAAAAAAAIQDKDPEVGEMDGLRTSKTVTQTNGYPNHGDGDSAAGGVLENQKTVTNGAPFTADDLAQAMSQSTITGSRW